MSETPIRIGYCLSRTGALASNGKTVSLAHEIWAEGVNRRGGLQMTRPIQQRSATEGRKPAYTTRQSLAGETVSLKGARCARIASGD
jgi:hypothetical protein